MVKTEDDKGKGVGG